MALKGDLRTLEGLKRALKKLPFTATARIAERAAPAMTELAQSAYLGGETVYGNPRPRSVVTGDELTLVRSGRSRDAAAFRSTGRDIRTAILPRYFKYLIARYGTLPNGPLPAEWRERMTEIAAQVLYDQIHNIDGNA